MKKIWVLLALVVMTLAAPGLDVEAQDSPQISGVERIRAAASRTGLSDDLIAPALASLARLEAEGLPTGRYVDRIVEFVAKRAKPEMISSRARMLEQNTRFAKDLLASPQAKELSLPDQAPPGWDPVEDLADALQSSPISSEDIAGVQRSLKSGSLARVLAGADALAHMRRMGLDEQFAHQLLSASKALPESEIRAFPSALFTGRRCGMEDKAIIAEVTKQIAKGKTPSEIAKKWSQSPSFKGRGNRNPNWTPGSGEGPGPGWRGGRGGEGGRQGGGHRGGGR